MSKSNKNNRNTRKSKRTTPNNRGPESIWKRIKRKVSIWFNQVLRSSKTFEFSFIKLDGEFFKNLALFVFSIAILIPICHYYNVDPEWAINTFIRVAKAIV